MDIRELMPELPEDQVPKANELLAGHHYLITYDPNLVDRRQMERVRLELEDLKIRALVIQVNTAFAEPLKLFKLDKP